MFSTFSKTERAKPRNFNKFSDYAALTLEGRRYAGFRTRKTSVSIV